MWVILNMVLEMEWNMVISGLWCVVGREESFRLNSIEKKMIGSILFFVIDVIMFVGISDKIVFIMLWELFCIVFVVFWYFEILMVVNCDIFILVLGWKMFVRVIFKMMVMVVIILK